MIGEELKRLREQKGETLEVASSHVNFFSAGKLEEIESGENKEPTPRVLYYLAQHYGASYPHLMRLAGYLVTRETS